jgi:hypothetical protein
MCNYSHDGAMKIKEYGIGYKLFRNERGTISLTGAVYCSKSEWVDWVDIFNSSIHYLEADPERYGFCFFKNLKEARKALKDWERETDTSNNVIGKIKYRKGIGEHLEAGFIQKPVPVCIARSFKFLKVI